MNRPASGLTVVFCGKLSGKPGPKSAAWRMPWQKSGADDGGENPRFFSAGPRTEHKGSRRRLRFSRPCDDGADRWSGVVCREIIIPFLARRLFPDVLCLSSGCAGRSGAVTGVVSLAARG